MYLIKVDGKIKYTGIDEERMRDLYEFELEEASAETDLILVLDDKIILHHPAKTKRDLAVERAMRTPAFPRPASKDERRGTLADGDEIIPDQTGISLYMWVVTQVFAQKAGRGYEDAPKMIQWSIDESEALITELYNRNRF